MSYTRPAGDAADFGFEAAAYTRPAGDEASFAFGRVWVLTGAVGVEIEAAAAAVYVFPRVRVAATTRARWGRSQAHARPLRARHVAAVLRDQPTRAPWVVGTPAAAQRQAPWVQALPVETAKVAPWGAYPRQAQPLAPAPWGVSRARDEASMAPWGRFLGRLQSEVDSVWPSAIAVDQADRMPWGGPLAGLQGGRLVAVIPQGVGVDRRRWLPWARYSRLLAPGWGVVVPPVVQGPWPEAPLYILPSRCYVAINSVSAARLPDLLEIPLREVTVSAAAGSFCWQLSASATASAFEALAPDASVPTLLRVTVNGIAWVFIVERLQREEVFGKLTTRISGRSQTALVGAPWQRSSERTNGAARTAQQLAEDALEFTDVTLDWGITDWLVPTGAWSHQGTPLTAVMAIAEAAGGHLLSHREAAQLLVRHPYAVAPWDWGDGSADVELAPDAIITAGIERRDGPDVNAVYVSGTARGVLARVKRAGSAGDKLSTLIADPLIVHADAARQRGLAVLGAAGAKQDVTLQLQVLTGPSEPGVLEIGQLVQVNDVVPWRGRVRSVALSARGGTVRQNVVIERHL